MANDKKEHKVWIRFLISPTGKYALGYNAGDEVEIGEKKAKEIVDNGDATYLQVVSAAPSKTTAGKAKGGKKAEPAKPAPAAAENATDADAGNAANASDIEVKGAQNASDPAPAGAEQR